MTVRYEPDGPVVVVTIDRPQVRNAVDPATAGRLVDCFERFAADDSLAVAVLTGADVPYNPLHQQGYPSIGCIPCTTPVLAGEDPRAGRWRGGAKKECGLHARAARPITSAFLTDSSSSVDKGQP